MTFFDTLKDHNAKAIFREVIWDKYKDGRTLGQIMNDLSYEERLAGFTLTHNIMKALGMPGWEKPMLLNREEPLCQEADA
ncbi:MAG: hypothetical protein EOO61_02375 [Hymenobacter sp.]|nr:MAG: hypothetical protein EOO61_02375 [Hymenobacter sp.]